MGHLLDRDEFAFAQTTDLLLQAEAALERAKAMSYFLRREPEAQAVWFKNVSDIQARIAGVREVL